MSLDRPPKKARLEQAAPAAADTRARLSQRVSQRDIAELSGTPQWECRKQLEIAKKATQVALEVEEAKTGKPLLLPICDHGKLLRHALQDSLPLQRAYAEAFEKAAGEPWPLVVAYDEFSPDSQIGGKHERKYLNASFNFLNLPRTVLANTDTWMTVLCSLARLPCLFMPTL